MVRLQVGKKTRYVYVRYLSVTERGNMKEISIEWCPTKGMIVDFMTSPLQGSYFKRLMDITMGKKQINPMVCKWLLVRVTCEELESKCCINEFGAIINVGVSHTTGVCWDLYSVGYCSLNMVQTWPLQVGRNRDLAIAGWTILDLVY